jgi:hypothetical protein
MQYAPCLTRLVLANRNSRQQYTCLSRDSAASSPKGMQNRAVSNTHGSAPAPRSPTLKGAHRTEEEGVQPFQGWGQWAMDR